MRASTTHFTLALTTFFSLALLASCDGENATPIQPSDSEDGPVIPLMASTSTAFQPEPLTPTADTIALWVSPGLPETLRTTAMALEGAAGRPIQHVDEPALATVRVEADAERPLATWVYAVVAPFPTLEDAMSMEALRAAWSGDGMGTAWYLTAATAGAMESVFGSPGAEVDLLDGDEEVLARAWEDRSARAIVPFEALEPRWKVLEVDGDSPVRKAFDVERYPLVVRFGLSGDPQAVEAVRAALDWPTTNWERDHLTIVVMTGVTALTRLTAWKMAVNGPLYPGELIGDWLREADLAHVSNEVAFSSACPRPEPYSTTMTFCSDPEHIALLDGLGVDLVELTGNHVLDWGPEAFFYTLALYRQHGLATFGGGANLEQAQQPALVEHNGNRLAFLGCNPAGPPYAWATASSPGATPCDEDVLFAELGELRSEGYLPVFTFQWAESERPMPLPNQVAAFRRAIDAGAVVVSGSQAHRPQTYEFYNDGFIHYGLGNLFFDQMQALQLRQELIDRHVFYNGRHINTEVLTALLEDYAQPRPMTPEERAALLAEIFAASGW